MKATTEQLLTDLFDDADFRGALMDRTLRAAKTRKTVRQLNTVLAAAALGAVLFFSVRKPHVALPPTVANLAPDPMVIASVSLQPKQIISTQVGSVKEFSSEAATVPVLATTSSSGHYQLIDDQQLLALFADRGAEIIRNDSGNAELIFRN